MGGVNYSTICRDIYLLLFFNFFIRICMKMISYITYSCHNHFYAGIFLRRCRTIILSFSLLRLLPIRISVYLCFPSFPPSAQPPIISPPLLSHSARLFLLSLLSICLCVFPRSTAFTYLASTDLTCTSSPSLFQHFPLSFFPPL